MDADEQLCAQLASLQHRSCMACDSSVSVYLMFGRFCGAEAGITVMAKIKAPVDPYAVVGDFHVFLGVNGPLTG